MVISYLGYEGKTLALFGTDPVHCVPLYYLSRCRLQQVIRVKIDGILHIFLDKFSSLYCSGLNTAFKIINDSDN